MIGWIGWFVKCWEEGQVIRLQYNSEFPAIDILFTVPNETRIKKNKTELLIFHHHKLQKYKNFNASEPSKKQHAIKH